MTETLAEKVIALSYGKFNMPSSLSTPPDSTINPIKVKISVKEERKSGSEAPQYYVELSGLSCNASVNNLTILSPEYKLASQAFKDYRTIVEFLDKGKYEVDVKLGIRFISS